MLYEEVITKTCFNPTENTLFALPAHEDVRITAIVPVRNEEALLVKTLDALFN